jgi:DNA polymerase-1
VILALGNTAARGFLGDYNFKITSKRGQVIDLDEIGLFVPTFHPASILRNQGEYPRWAEDVKYAGKLLAGGPGALKDPGKPTAYIMLAEPGEAEWDDRIIDGSQLKGWPTRKVITGIPAAVRAVDYLLQLPVLSADIETGYSYSPRAGKVLALGVSWSTTEGVVFSEGLLESKAFRPHLVRLLTSPGPLWIGHNFKYDSSYLRHQILGSEWPTEGALVSYHDTLLEHYCLDEAKGTHALEDLSRDLLGAEDYKYVVRKYAAKGSFGYEDVPREILYPYCLLDTSHTFALHEILCPKVHASPSLTRLYEHLLLPASRFLQKVQDYGLWVDQAFIRELDVELSARVVKAKADLTREVEPIWDTDEYMASQWATRKRPEGYNARNWRHTAFMLYKLIGWVPMNTNERTLRDLDQTGRDQSAIFGYKAKNYARGHPDRKAKLNYPYIQALIDVRMAQRAYDVLVKRIWKDIDPVDGRLHTTFNLQATETGRLSSTNPNLQNLPVPEKDDPKPARNIVGAPPGRVIMEADYSQIELRLLAHFSGDEFLLGVYRDGRDLHTEVSIAIWGPGFTNYQRVRAKAVNFGIAYGRGAGSIAAEFDIPEEEAEEMRQAWLARAPQAAAWLDKLHQAPFTGRTVVSPFGRRRRFGVVSRENYYELKNQSANFPMQSTASDLTLYSAIRAQEKWDTEGTDAHVICLVHDAVVVECPEELAPRVETELTAIMEDTPRRILRPSIDFPVDVHVGRSWGTLKLGEMTGGQKGA